MSHQQKHAHPDEAVARGFTIQRRNALTRCPHGDKDWRCPTCCLMELRRDHPRLTAAVRAAEKSQGTGRATPGSRVPAGFGTAALALLQDIMQAGGLDGVEAQLQTMRDPVVLATLRTNVRKWRSKAALVLHDAHAPYPLTWDTTIVKPDGTPVVVTRSIPCPVVNETGGCGGALEVHRDNDANSVDYGKAAVIICRANDDHAWTLNEGGWLRLGVLLGGVA